MGLLPRLWKFVRTPSPTSRPRPRRKLAIEVLENREVPAVGGGFTSGGILGEYFDNIDLQGTPAFSRRDVRIDFDWQDRAPGGSTSPDYRQVGADYFSVRWTGQFVPAFTESYTFRTTSDEGIRLWVRPANGSAAWTLLIDHWDAHPATTHAAAYDLIAGRTYDLRLEYYEAEGPATVRLAWSSRSTPEEVIDPAVNLGVNAVTYDYHLYADVGKSGRADWGDPFDYFGRPRVALDAAGWPTADAGHLFWEGEDPALTGGTYLLVFQGQAEVSGWMGRGVFSVDGTYYGTSLPAGAGYDPLTNTTTAQVRVDGTELFGLNFRNTRRGPLCQTNTGITNVKLMRPVTPGSNTSYRPDDLFVTEVKDAFSRYTTLRYLTANFNREANWSDRKLPGGLKAAWADRASVWEYHVLLANETGKDLYITLPVGATDEYIRNVAHLIRYGSDGVLPYTGPVADPVYPGLNPNLRVYVEWGNEVWNWAFDQGGWAADRAVAEVHNNTPNGQIINFDGLRPHGDFRRWAALRTVQTSNIFRAVWGDAAMGDRVRVVLGYQYDNQQNTAMGALTFLDQYFNNGDGNPNVPDPRPVSYYIWGAGGASYFSASNPRGLVSNIVVPGGTFEGVAVGGVGKAKQAPAGSPWRFDGDAGIYRNQHRVAVNAPMDIEGVGRVPAAPQGHQALYISGKGSAWVTINFTRPGVYALDFKAAGEFGPDMVNPLDFYIDDTKVTPNGPAETASLFPWWPGNGVGRNPNAFHIYGTVPVTITKPGRYTFKIVGRGSPARTTVIDDIRVASVDAIFASRMPAGGQAAGQVSRTDYQAQLAAQAAYARAFGLKVVAYEGGWSLGGDYESVPIQTWAKYHDPRGAAAQAAAIDAFHRAGGELNILGTYDQWRRDDAANAASYPLVRGIDARLDRLPAAPTVGILVPVKAACNLSPGSALATHKVARPAAPGNWLSWTIRVTATGDYRVTAVTAPGGTAAVYVNGHPVDQGASGSLVGDVVRLTPGVHTIRVQSLGGTFLIRRATVVRVPDVPAAPTPTPPGVPVGWMSQDIGQPDVPGMARFDGTRWTVQGAGPGPWGTEDAFQFPHTWAVGDVALIGRVDSLTGAIGLGQVGVMARSGLGVGDPFAGIFLGPGNQILFQYRAWDRGPIREVAVPSEGMPRWLKLVRRGDTLDGYFSTDGETWTAIGEPVSVGLPGAIRVGLSVTSFEPGQAAVATAVFTSTRVG